MSLAKLQQINAYTWELPPTGQMQVPAIFFGSREIIQGLEDKVLVQASNVAMLPGIVQAAYAMPDAHWGYGFPIGGVAAFDPQKGGVISVGGIGYDISCGVRTLRTRLTQKDLAPYLQSLLQTLYQNIPAGVGAEGKIKLTSKQLDQVLISGAKWAVDQGFGTPEDLQWIEDNGRTPGANPDKVSTAAKKRQHSQIGTLGSGNHYLEIQLIEKIFDHATAQAFGLATGEVVISIHCGSRALGHQIGTDYIQILGKAAQRYKIQLPERELVCAPILSPEGQDFYQAMVCGINCALANRQVLTHLVREIFSRFFPQTRLTLLYDVSHNTCKTEEHPVNGKDKTLYVHRKGATRAFAPGHPALPSAYREYGQPVIIGGTMGTASYILAGNANNNLAFSSACHGAGRSMSRRQATRRWKGGKIIQELAAKGIYIQARSKKGAAEEAPQAYKDVDLVVDSTAFSGLASSGPEQSVTRDAAPALHAGLARKVARLKPLACIKG